MPGPRLDLTAVTTPLKRAFAISRGAKTAAETVQVTLRDSTAAGRGECVPYARYGESVAGVVAAIEAVRGDIEAGLDRAGLQAALPAGAARCALDCAFWDLQAKRSGIPAWQAAGLPPPRPVESAETVGLAAPDEMAAAARAIPGRLLKLKLGGADDLARVEAVHAARPDARLIIDGNEGILAGDLPGLLEAAARLGVVLVEQPLPAGADRALKRGRFPVPVCADESVHTAADIPRLAPHYDAVNVKLDKTGGLTGALALVAAARAEGMGVMVGCMVAGSLSMAPAVLLAAAADFADLDGPLWLDGETAPTLRYEAGQVAPPGAELWG